MFENCFFLREQKVSTCDTSSNCYVVSVFLYMTLKVTVYGVESDRIWR